MIRKLDAVYNVVGTFVFFLYQWLLLVFVARFFGQTRLGELSLILSYCTPLLMLFNLQIRTRFPAIDAAEVDLSNLLFLRAQSSIFVFVLMMLIAYFRHPTDLFSSLIFLVLIVFLKICEHFSELFYSLYQRQDLLKFTARSLILKSIVSILILLTFKKIGLVPVFSLILIVNLIVLLWDFCVFHQLGKKYEHSDLSFKKSGLLLKNYLPLSITSFFISLVISVPKLILEQHFGLEALGEFTLLYYFCLVLALVLSSVVQSQLTGLKRASESKKTYLEMAGKIFKVIVFGNVVYWVTVRVIGNDFMGFVYGSSFRLTGLQTGLLTLLGVLISLSAFFNVLLMSLHVFDVQMRVSSFVLFSTFILSYSLIPEYGILGTLITVTGSRLVQLLLLGLAFYSSLCTRYQDKIS